MLGSAGTHGVTQQNDARVRALGPRATAPLSDGVKRKPKGGTPGDLHYRPRRMDERLRLDYAVTGNALGPASSPRCSELELLVLLLAWQLQLLDEGLPG